MLVAVGTRVHKVIDDYKELSPSVHGMIERETVHKQAITLLMRRREITSRIKYRYNASGTSGLYRAPLHS